MMIQGEQYRPPSDACLAGPASARIRVAQSVTLRDSMLACRRPLPSTTHTNAVAKPNSRTATAKGTDTSMTRSAVD